MPGIRVLILVIAVLAKNTIQDETDNEVDDKNVFADAAVNFLKDQQNLKHIGSAMNDFIQSGGGKQLGDMLMGAASGDNGAAAGQILQGLGSLMSQNQKGKGGFDPSLIGSVLGMLNSGGGKSNDKGIDPSLIGNVLSMLTTNNKEGGKGFDPSMIGNVLSMLNTDNKEGGKGFDPSMIANVLSMLNPDERSKNEGFDPSNLLALAGNFVGQPGGAESLLDLLPSIVEYIGSFLGIEGDFFSGKHEDHQWTLPPILERVHVLFEQFINSEGGKNLINVMGAEKFIKIFTDDKGNFDYGKFVEMLENHSFRRHWISMVTTRMAEWITYLSDPKIQKKYLVSIQFFANSLLKGQGYPKSALLDLTRPTESITALANHASKKYFNYKISSKQYVKPAVEYFQELFRLGQSKGFFSGSDTRELSHKLTDTINLEVIEPIARVNRAYRFAKKVPRCDRYVMCLVNQESPQEQLSLPGLKSSLSKSASLFASWFLSSYTSTSFWEMYSVITESNDCKAFYRNECNDFHIEEIKVTTEYVHSEL